MWRTNLFCVHKILPVGVKVNSIANVYTVNHGREKINFRIRVKTSRDCFCQSHFFRMTFMLLSVMHLFQQINTFELEHIQKFFIVRDSHCAISPISVNRKKVASNQYRDGYSQTFPHSHSPLFSFLPAFHK